MFFMNMQFSVSITTDQARIDDGMSLENDLVGDYILFINEISCYGQFMCSVFVCFTFTLMTASISCWSPSLKPLDVE